MKNDPITVLLVDSTPSDAAIIESLMDQTGKHFVLRQAKGLDQTLEHLAKDIDVILFDLTTLPEDERLETLARIRENVPEIPIIALMTSDTELATRVIQAGAHDCLLRDQLTRETLVHTISCTVERERMRLQLERYTRELQTNEARFRNLITRNADGVVVVDKDGIVRFVNPAAESLLGHTADELLGELFGFPLVTGETTEIDFITRSSGERGIAEMRVVETHWEDDTAYLTSLRDITLRKEAEQALRNAEQCTRSILNALDSHVAVVDEHGTIVTTNDAWSQFGQNHQHYTLEHARADDNYFETCKQVFGSSSQVAENTRLVIEDKSDLFEFDYTYRDADQQEYLFHMRVMPLEKCYQHRIVISLSDITESRRAAQAEARAEANESRLREQENEIVSLLELSGSSSSTSVTAGLFGTVTIHESVPHVFEEIVRHYDDLIELAMEQRTYKVKHGVSEKLRAMAERLGFLRAGPRDIIEIHSTILQRKSKSTNPVKSQAYAEEGRMMVLELMGYLVSYYRSYSLGMRKNLRHEAQNEQESKEQEKDYVP
jgi:PAS domain-containing protein